MLPTISTVDEYIAQLPVDRKKAISLLRKEIKKNIPKGFKEGMGYGMIGYVVPHSLYAAGYHCDERQPLPFASIASQKNHIAFYHMCLYGDKNMHDWFVKEYPKHTSAKLDMGKSCIRFKNPEAIPYKLIGELMSKVTPQQWIERYENIIKPRKQ